jgi:hypothetical protein
MCLKRYQRCMGRVQSMETHMEEGNVTYIVLKRR